MVVCGVGQQNWCFEVWYQMFVGVCGGVCECIDCLCVFDDVVDVIEVVVRQVGVVVVCKQWFVVFLD